jgi:hypothetical protein
VGNFALSRGRRVTDRRIGQPLRSKLDGAERPNDLFGRGLNDGSQEKHGGAVGRTTRQQITATEEAASGLREAEFERAGDFAHRRHHSKPLLTSAPVRIGAAIRAKITHKFLGGGFFLDPQVVIHGNSNVLLRTKISLRCLNRAMPK